MKIKRDISILVATNRLVELGGSETFTITLISALQLLGYSVDYFTLTKGDLAVRLEKEYKVNFLSRKKYDLILANHVTCVEALFGYGFIIQTCHGVFSVLEEPSNLANYHVSISQEVQNSLALKGVVSTIIWNGIDTRRFYRTKKVSSQLNYVLSLCQSTNANEFLKEICQEMNINFAHYDKNSNPEWDIEDKINEADLVVGLGRSVYEAMACGRPVIVYDEREYLGPIGDGYLTNILASSIVHNCSGRFYKKVYTKEQMILEFKKYKPSDGDILSKFIDDNLASTVSASRYIQLYDEIKHNPLFKTKSYYYKFLSYFFYRRKLLSILDLFNWLIKK